MSGQTRAAPPWMVRDVLPPPTLPKITSTRLLGQRWKRFTSIRKKLRITTPAATPSNGSQGDAERDGRLGAPAHGPGHAGQSEEGRRRHQGAERQHACEPGRGLVAHVMPGVMTAQVMRLQVEIMAADVMVADAQEREQE